MSIELKITGETLAEVVQEIVGFALTAVPQLRNNVPATAAPETVVEPAAETVTPVRKPRASKKANETIEHDEKEGHGDVLRGAGDGTVSEGGDAKRTEPASEASGDAAGADAANDDAPAGGGAEIALSVDDLRKFIINDYLNASFTEQADKSNAFRALLDEFSLGKLGDASADQIGPIKARVDVLIAEKAAA